MPKLLNRNINTAFNVFGVPHKPKEKKNYVEYNYNLGESSKNFHHNTKESSNYFKIGAEDDKSVDSDVESIILDLNKLGGLSSSSSLSWSDDYETETTKKVYDELRRLDRVLKGEETIPPNYDKDECEQWMTRFPNLSIFDDDKTPTNSMENISWSTHFERIEIPLHYDCDMMQTNEQKLTVMSSSPKILMNYEGTPLVSHKRKLKVHNDNYFVTSKPKSLDIDQYLKVSPVVQNKRKQSAKSLLNRQISRESPDHPEYSSLPHIKVDSLPTLKLQKSSQHIRKKPYSKTSGRNDNRLILPPIDIDQFRSVSAIPTENFKTLSALSVNSNFKDKFNKKKHSIGAVKNPVSSRRETNIFLV